LARCPRCEGENVHADLYPVGRASVGRALAEEHLICDDCGHQERATRGTPAHARMRAGWGMEADPADSADEPAPAIDGAAEADVD
jgi:hypothetical protein